jgi:hypothetical protein
MVENSRICAPSSEKEDPEQAEAGVEGGEELLLIGRTAY